jgi:hypothetical protein
MLTKCAEFVMGFKWRYKRMQYMFMSEYPLVSGSKSTKFDNVLNSTAGPALTRVNITKRNLSKYESNVVTKSPSS